MFARTVYQLKEVFNHSIQKEKNGLHKKKIDVPYSENKLKKLKKGQRISWCLL